MKTTFEFKEGLAGIVEDVAPSFDFEAKSVSGITVDDSVLTDEIPLDLLKRVIWEA